MTKRTFEVEFFWKIREWVEVAATSPRQALRLAHTLRDSRMILIMSTLARKCASFITMVPTVVGGARTWSPSSPTRKSAR